MLRIIFVERNTRMLSPCNDLLMDSICFAKCLINIEKIENRFVAFHTAFGGERETMTSNPNLSFEQLTLLLDPIIQLLFHLLKYIYSFFICIYIYIITTKIFTNITLSQLHYETLIFAGTVKLESSQSLRDLSESIISSIRG